MILSIETCVIALNHAAKNRKAALQLEFATGLAVFHLHGGTNEDARRMLKEAYAASGYLCTHVIEPDYKTINRRINATAALYEKLPIAKWVGHLANMDVIQAVCEGLAPYELYTVQDALRFAAPDRVYVNPPRVAVAPDASILAGPTTGQHRVMEQFRRASDHPGQRVATEHLCVTIPKDTPAAELLELAIRIMSLVKETERELLTA